MKIKTHLIREFLLYHFFVTRLVKIKVRDALSGFPFHVRMGLQTSIAIFVATQMETQREMLLAFGDNDR